MGGGSGWRAGVAGVMDGWKSRPLCEDEGRPPPPLAPSAYLQQLHPQVQPFPGQVSPQVQFVHVQFALPQLQVACSAVFSGLFIVSLVFVVRRHKSPGTPPPGRYILMGTICINGPRGRAACGPCPMP